MPEGRTKRCKSWIVISGRRTRETTLLISSLGLLSCHLHTDRNISTSGTQELSLREQSCFSICGRADQGMPQFYKGKVEAFFSLLAQSVLINDSILRRESLCAPGAEIFRSACKRRDGNSSEEIKTVVSHVRLALMNIHDLLHVVRPSGIFESEEIFEATDQLKPGRNLPGRSVLFTTDKPYEQVITLSNVFSINYIQITFPGRHLVTCHVEVLRDRTHWDRVGTATFLDSPHTVSIRILSASQSVPFATFRS